MLFSGQPQGRHYWDGTKFVMAPMPPQGLLSPQQPATQPPAVAPSQFQQQIGQGNDNGGGNTIGGAPTSSAAAPAGFSTAGTPNPGQSPSIAGSQNSRSGMSGGTAGGLAGAVAGLATGVPGLGLLGNTVGTLAGVSRANSELERAGLSPAVSFGPSFISGMTGGFGGQSIASQVSAEHARNAAAAMGDLALGYEPGYAMDLSARSMADMTSKDFGMSPLSAVLGGWGGLFGSPNDGSGLGGIGAGATGHLGTTADGREAGYGALGTPSSYGFGDLGGFGGPSNDSGGGGMSGAAGDPGADGGPSGPWRKGGYTGDDGDGKLEPKLGVVHEREYVIRPEATAYYGKGLLKAINERRIPRGLLAG